MAAPRVFLLALAGALGLTVLSADAAQESADLTGSWILDRQASSAPGSAPAEPDIADGPEPGPGRPGGGFGGGMGRRRGGMGGLGDGGRRPTDEAARKRTRALLEELLEAAASFTITRSDTAVTFVFPDGRTRTYVANDAKERHQFTNGTVETRAKWDNSALVIRTRVSDRVTLVQTYARHQELPRLIVTSRIDGTRRDRPGIEHVYARRDDAGQG